ncbi:MAG TPA: DUF6084 family protein [Thermoleophilaceae bacterium]|nr:DUF6084 family protein [Thermoleophilaceae bacterium]
MPAPLPTAGTPTAQAAGPRLTFSVEEGGVLEPSAVPTLRFALRIGSGGVPVRSVALNVQLRIAATRRTYSDRDEDNLAELFGHREQWKTTLRSLHWTNVALQVGPFTDVTTVELPVTCTYDLEVTGTRYLHALQDGDIPLEFLFAGSMFYAGPGGALQVQPISWAAEAEYRLPVAVWRQMMDRHFPDAAWLRVRRDVFERLHAYRGRHALMTWEETFDSLLREDAP